jgi:hypothetical protein
LKEGIIYVIDDKPYLWEQSDDIMVQIWRASDWVLEADIENPFVNAPATTLFSRPRYGHHENAVMDYLSVFM